MKVDDIIKDDTDRKVARVANLLKKKKKVNPKQSKGGSLNSFIDVFHGISGSGDSGGEAQGSLI